jgi:hypothetical protein
MAKQAKRYGLGQFNSPVSIRFSVDKNGQPRAWRSHPGQMREFPIGYDRAKLLVASGDGVTENGR